MDHKAWLWRKKSTEKTIVTTDKIDLSLKGKEEEVQTLLTNKEELENDLKTLNDRMSSALSDCKAKDDLLKKQEKMAQDAIAGTDKAEAEIASLKQERDEALQKIAVGEERLTHMDAALKECMQQLRFVREEQEKRIHDAVMKASREFEKSQMILEEKLAETNNRLAKLSVENTQLSKALLAKEKLIEELSKRKTQVEADLSALMTRLESTEKDNASLKYEVRVIEKELEIRNEEREFNRRTADASHKQHLENVKKIAKLESECQRLRLLVRKRLPGPAALAKMKNEVEMLGRDSAETRRRRSSLSPTGLIDDSSVDNSPDTHSKKTNHLTERLCAIEVENKSLKEALKRKTNELQSPQIMDARTNSKISEFESQLEESSKYQVIVDPARSGVVSHDLSMTSIFDVGSEDKVSCSELRASALISELESFKTGKPREALPCTKVQSLDINLMDDFIEMEKLAIVSVEKPSESLNIHSDDDLAIAGPVKTGLSLKSSEVQSRERVLAMDCQSDFSEPNRERKSKDILMDKYPGWLQNILKLVLEQIHVTQRNTDEILEDIRTALACINHSIPGDFFATGNTSNHTNVSAFPCVDGYISWGTSNKSSVMESSYEATDGDILLTEKTSKQLHSDLSKSICRVIELIEGISLPSNNYATPEAPVKKDCDLLLHKISEAPSGYIVRLFQWKTSEVSAVLQHFVRTCYDLLNGKVEIKSLIQELASALDWIMNHCFSLQDVSSMKDEIKKHCDWDESRSEGEAEVGIIGQFAEADKLCLPKEQMSSLSAFAASNVHEELLSNMIEENSKLRDELIGVKAAKTALDEKLQSATEKSESLSIQLQDSKKIISSLPTEIETLKSPKVMIENHVEDCKSINEDLDTQLTVARVELNEARHKISSLEVELENKNCCYEDLEATCLELKLQLESVAQREIPNHELRQEEKQLRTDQEITAASAKLAECQETILYLGKQLKALASPREAALFDKVISSPSHPTSAAVATITTTTAATTPSKPPNKIINQRSSLLDQMIAEDGGEGSYGNREPLEKILILSGNKYQHDDATKNALAIVPSKKNGGGSLWRKLLRRKKKGNSKKTPFPFSQV